MFKFYVVTFILIFGVVQNDSANILAIFPMPSKSHHIITSRLTIALAEKGHNVTVVSPYAIKDKMPNHRDIYLDGIEEFKKERMEKNMHPNVSMITTIINSLGLLTDIHRIVLDNPKVQALKNEEFDLIFLFGMFPEPSLGLAHHFKAPVILFNTIGQNTMVNRMFGNPSLTPFIPAPSSDMISSFTHRLKHTLGNTLYNLVIAPFLDCMNQRLLNEYFPDAPSIHELIEEHVALIFLNSHVSVETPRPHLPNMIQIGGLQITDPKPLPKDLQEFLDNAKDGAILFSLGSNVKVSSLEKYQLEDILYVFGNLKEKVLFKSEIDIPNAPKNVKVSKWLPQNDILAHKNIKMFVSHGGLLSTTEAVYHGVPIIGIPFFGDQKNNVHQAALNGYATYVDLMDLNRETFKKAVDDALKDTKLRDNIQLRSSLLKNQPMKPLDTALYWVDHVLQYKGAKHLQAAGAKLNLIQYSALDAYVVLLVGILIVVFIVKTICKYTFRFVKKLCCSKKVKKD